MRNQRGVILAETSIAMGLIFFILTVGSGMLFGLYSHFLLTHEMATSSKVVPRTLGHSIQINQITDCTLILNSINKHLSAASKRSKISVEKIDLVPGDLTELIRITITGTHQNTGTLFDFIREHLPTQRSIVYMEAPVELNRVKC
jgi:hypothetical protein